MWYKNVGTISFFRFVTKHAFDKQTDRKTLAIPCVCVTCSRTYQYCEVRTEVYKDINGKKFTLDGRKFQIFITRLSFLGLRIVKSLCILHAWTQVNARSYTLCVDREYQQHEAVSEDLHRLPIKSHGSLTDSTKDNQICYILNSEVVPMNLLFASSRYPSCVDSGAFV